MNRDVTRRTLCVALASVLALPLGPTAHAIDLYARAIGDPYSYQPERAPPPEPVPAAPAPAAEESLPALGGEEATGASPAESGGWSWGRVLVGIAVVGAMAALASKSGGGGQVNVDSGSVGSVGTTTPTAPEAGSGGGDTGSGPLPTLPLPGGDDDDDDDDRKGKKRR
ncbi:hypothetical protein SVA_3779 [Sulfurifustis variabilis]|uniref:Uncharacterized protein n=1 Tax=Sulfurifustis variabilis TaxID=1675686 RepID=A0A1C7AFW7_9GAMM|nr:hypothetical protein [Sulfurifustis variabilis]BAU50313.1 hypothetical protein SVA_3779 [Sulfurifustis variabilis]